MNLVRNEASPLPTADAMVAAITSRETLLGIPSELRLHIYDFVLDENASGWTFCYKDSRGLTTQIRRHPEDAAAPCFPWLSLLLTCSRISRELKEHMMLASADADAAWTNAITNTTVPTLGRRGTYEMSIEADYRSLVRMTWSSISCPPSECRALTVHMTLPQDVSFWGDGGPAPIVRELYQTLNKVLHCGPRLDANTPLSHPMFLELLVVVVTVESGSGVKSQHTSTEEARRALQSLWGIVGQLEDTGLLNGLVRRIVLGTNAAPGFDQGQIEGEVMVSQRKKPGKVPPYWSGYGFEWGITGSTSDGQE